MVTGEGQSGARVRPDLTPIPFGGNDEPVPNEHTIPPPGHDDALRDLVRPMRATRPPDRLDYASIALASAYDQCAAHGFDLGNGRMPQEAFAVNLLDGADRLVAEAFDLYEVRGMAFTVTDEVELRSTFNEATDETRRAAVIALDAAHASCEFGPTAPQTLLARELYAAAVFDAACHGIHVPRLGTLMTITTGAYAGVEVTSDFWQCNIEGGECDNEQKDTKA